MDRTTVASAPASDKFASNRYTAYVLLLLCFTNAFNLGDRMLIGTLQEPLRLEFRLSDFQLGLLGGPAFAVLYTILGFPIAKWAERGNRVTIIAVALATWSTMTALCGAAMSYTQLFAARVGVSIGEAGCAPPAHSLIAEYFPRERRATAMSTYAVGAPLGMMVVSIVGGYIAQHYGWRYAMATFGMAGVLVALLIKLTLHEPRQLSLHPPVASSMPVAIRTLLAKRAFVHVCLGAAMVSMASNFLAQYMVSFLMRSHDLPLANAALVAGVGGAGGAALGTYVSGVIADRWSHHNPVAIARVPVIGILIAVVLYWIALSVPVVTVAIPFLLLAPAFQNSYMGQSIAMVQSVAPNNMRATAAAMFIFANSLIGFGLGPPLFGLLSDFFAASGMAQAGIDTAVCAANPQLDACALAQAQGLRWSLLASTLLFFWSVLHFNYASRFLVRDLAD